MEFVERDGEMPVGKGTYLITGRAVVVDEQDMHGWCCPDWLVVDHARIHRALLLSSTFGLHISGRAYTVLILAYLSMSHQSILLIGARYVRKVMRRKRRLTST